MHCNLSKPSRRRRQEPEARCSFSPQRLHVFCIVVGNPGFPTAKDDSDPFIRQGPDCSVMPGPTFSLHVVIGPSPLALGYRMAGKLMETLLDKARTGPTVINKSRLATVSGHRSNPGVFLHLVSGIETISVRPHRRLKAWRQCGPCSREAIKDLRIRVLSKYCFDLLFDASNSIEQGA